MDVARKLSNVLDMYFAWSIILLWNSPPFPPSAADSLFKSFTSKSTQKLQPLTKQSLQLQKISAHSISTKIRLSNDEISIVQNEDPNHVIKMAYW